MEFNVGKVGINLGGYGIYLGDKGSLSVYIPLLVWATVFKMCDVNSFCYRVVFFVSQQIASKNLGF